MSFYPSNYKRKESQSDYMRLAEGEQKVRILTAPIMGFETWSELDGKKTPHRARLFSEAINLPSEDGKVKEFNAFIVWDYSASMVRVLNVTQRTIQEAIYLQTLDSDWSDPTKYDIVIKRMGKGMDTEYTVVFKLPKELEPQITLAFKAVTISPDNYFSGGHPIVRETDQTTEVSNSVVDQNQDIDF